MATDARFACPVCSEPYEAPPAECFRCESRLDPWWRFEEGVARSEARPAEQPRRLVPIAAAAVFGALAAAVALRIMTGTAHAPADAVPATVAAVPSASIAPAPSAPPRAASTPAPAPTVAYRVQPGDSLWRIAAAFTGDGRRWRALWPERDPAQPLAVGTVIEVPVR